VAYVKITQDLERETGINHEELNNDNPSPNSKQQNEAGTFTVAPRQAEPLATPSNLFVRPTPQFLVPTHNTPPVCGCCFSSVYSGRGCRDYFTIITCQEGLKKTLQKLMWVPPECVTCYCRAILSQHTSGRMRHQISRCKEVCCITGKVKIITSPTEGHTPGPTPDKTVARALSGEDDTWRGMMSYPARRIQRDKGGSGLCLFQGTTPAFA
jgi:hypothetical protein